MSEDSKEIIKKDGGEQNSNKIEAINIDGHNYVSFDDSRIQEHCTSNNIQPEYVDLNKKSIHANGKVHLRVGASAIAYITALTLFAGIGLGVTASKVRHNIKPANTMPSVEQKGDILTTKSKDKTNRFDVKYNEEENNFVVKRTSEFIIPKEQIDTVRVELEKGKKLRNTHKINQQIRQERLASGKLDVDSVKDIEFLNSADSLVEFMCYERCVDEYTIDENNKCITNTTQIYNSNDCSSVAKYSVSNKNGTYLDFEDGGKRYHKLVLNPNNLPKEGSIRYLSLPEGILVC